MIDLGTHEIKSKYVNGPMYLTMGEYGDGSPALIINTPSGEEVAIATVRLDVPPRAGYLWLKGWSENEGIPAALEDCGLVKLTGKTRPTGFVLALEAEFVPATILKDALDGGTNVAD